MSCSRDFRIERIEEAEVGSSSGWEGEDWVVGAETTFSYVSLDFCFTIASACFINCYSLFISVRRIFSFFSVREEEVVGVAPLGLL